MKYSFEKKQISKTTFYDVTSDLEILNRFGDNRWTPERAQEIIDGIENVNSVDEPFKWANEAVLVIAHTDTILLFDLVADRAGIGKQEEDLELSPQEFLQFLYDFKKFIGENS